MAARIEKVFDDVTKKSILDSKLLVVGAGGVGCELLKNLVLTGFENIHVIDLDTIDVSNLNRQFLFQKSHVGKPKAIVAKESVLSLNPQANITAYHDSITNMKYNIEFYRQFSAVANALDNQAARKHVNRMCLAADVPLIESGSSGYLGQVTVYKKKLSECYECEPRPAPKDYPTCTIRNTPSETIHCVVWAKHLFNQLFGEDDPHQDVSPDVDDTADTQGSGDGAASSATSVASKISTKEWAKNCDYDPKTLFTKLFHDDVKYLLTMKHLWENRKQPVPLVWMDLPDAVPGSSMQDTPSMKDQEIPSIKECANIFAESLSILRKRATEESGTGVLIWDKDDKHCMDFVTACANMRCYCFCIPQESSFKIKSMAGNIIPAIASTNAVIGGLIVLQLFKVLNGQFDKCRTVILNKSAIPGRNKLVMPVHLSKPNSSCFVCSPQTPEVIVNVNPKTMTLKTIEEKILIGSLNMIAPDVLFDDGKGTILISSDPDEDIDGLKNKTLEELKVQAGARFQCDDFFQQFALVLRIYSSKDLHDQEFEILSDETKDKEKKGNEKSTDSVNSNDESFNIIECASDIEDEDDTLINMSDSESGDDEVSSSKMRLDTGSGNGVEADSQVSSSKRHLDADSGNGVEADSEVSSSKRLDTESGNGEVSSSKRKLDDENGEVESSKKAKVDCPDGMIV